MLHIVGTIIIGFVAGVIAKLVTPGDKEPQGFILTAILGIVGAFVATYLGQAIGWYGPDQNAGFIGAIVGAAIILLVGDLLNVVDESEFDIIHHAAISSCGKRASSTSKACNNICRQYSGEAMAGVLGKPLGRSVI